MASVWSGHAVYVSLDIAWTMEWGNVFQSIEGGTQKKKILEDGSF